MRVERLFAVALAAVMVSADAYTMAQQPPQKPAPSMPDMVNVMHECQRMMVGARAMMPNMPPSNEKLQFQMHAEMMQKLGEIASKYAERIGGDTRDAPR